MNVRQKRFFRFARTCASVHGILSLLLLILGLLIANDRILFLSIKPSPLLSKQQLFFPKFSSNHAYALVNASSRALSDGSAPLFLVCGTQPRFSSKFSVTGSEQVDKDTCYKIRAEATVFPNEVVSLLYTQKEPTVRLIGVMHSVLDVTYALYIFQIIILSPAYFLGAIFLLFYPRASDGEDGELELYTVGGAFSLITITALANHYTDLFPTWNPLAKHVEPLGWLAIITVPFFCFMAFFAGFVVFMFSGQLVAAFGYKQSQFGLLGCFVTPVLYVSTFAFICLVAYVAFAALPYLIVCIIKWVFVLFLPSWFNTLVEMAFAI